MVEIDVNESIGLYYECTECGNDEIELGDNFCKHCGAAIEWKEN